MKDVNNHFAARGRLVKPSGLLSSNLCKTVSFEVGEKKIQVVFYLDDP